jgi:Yippee zinc-binding/DNA-binding /Mis18, centromere assembly
MGSNLPALLFRRSVNLDPSGPQREESLSTGKYILQDVACRACSTQLGWQYVAAEAQEQKYKEKCMLLRLEELQRVNRVTGTRVPGRGVHSSAAGTSAGAIVSGSFHRNVQQPVYDPHGSRFS